MRNQWEMPQQGEKEKKPPIEIGATIDFTDSEGKMRRWTVKNIDPKVGTVALESKDDNGRFIGGNKTFDSIERLLEEKEARDRLPRKNEEVRVEFSDGRSVPAWIAENIETKDRTILVTLQGGRTGKVELSKIRRPDGRPILEEERYDKAA